MEETFVSPALSPQDLSSSINALAASISSRNRDGSFNDERQPLLDNRPEFEVPSSSRSNSMLIIFCLSCTTLITSFLSGNVTIAVPQISRDLGLDPSIELWPVSMYALSTGCTLLIAGSLADVVGSKEIFLLGCALQVIFSMACGLSQTGTQLIVFRIFSGLATSCCLPTAISLIMECFRPGKRRNIAFAIMGGAQPIGFGLGLTVGGIFADTVGWKWGFHSVALVNAALLALAFWQLPSHPKNNLHAPWRRFVFGIDWVGALSISISLGMLSYVLADITDDVLRIKSPSSIGLLLAALLLLVFFISWMSRRERQGKPALIPNSLWGKKAFTGVSINVFLVWGAFNAFEQVTNFFFQNVQGLSALDAAWRFLPVSVSGAIAAFVTGAILHIVRSDVIMTVTTVVSAVSPILMAFANPKWTYWAAGFPSVFLNSICADSLFTVSNIIISSSFPEETQGLAGGVFNTVSQIGRAVGFTMVALTSNVVTDRSSIEDKSSPEALMVGYRASYWLLFGMYVVSLVVSVWGLRGVAHIGQEKKSTENGEA